MNAISGISGGYSAQPFTQGVQERFTAADLDQSGTVSKDEFLSATERINQPIEPEKIFDRIDSNSDGVLSQAEHQAFVDQMTERFQKMASMSSGTGDQESSVKTLLEALSNTESYAEQLRLEETYARQGNEQKAQDSLSSKLLEQFSSQYPAINLSV